MHSWCTSITTYTQPSRPKASRPKANRPEASRPEARPRIEADGFAPGAVSGNRAGRLCQVREGVCLPPSGGVILAGSGGGRALRACARSQTQKSRFSPSSPNTRSVFVRENTHVSPLSWGGRRPRGSKHTPFGAKTPESIDFRGSPVFGDETVFKIARMPGGASPAETC